MVANVYTTGNQYLGSVHLSVMLKPGFRLTFKSVNYIVKSVYQLPEQANTKAYNVVLEPAPLH